MHADQLKAGLEGAKWLWENYTYRRGKPLSTVQMVDYETAIRKLAVFLGIEEKPSIFTQGHPDKGEN